MNPKAAGIVEELAAARSVAADGGPEALLVRLDAVGITLSVNFTDAETRRVTLAAFSALRGSLARALAGDPEATAELARISGATPATSSPYVALDALCVEWKKAAPVCGDAAWREYRERLMRLDAGFFRVQEDRLVELVCDPKIDARAMAFALVFESGAVCPRTTGESAERHQKRLKQAFADARSKSSPARKPRRTPKI